MFGYLDDLIIVPAGLALARQMIPEEVLCECRGRGRLRDQPRGGLRCRHRATRGGAGPDQPGQCGLAVQEEILRMNVSVTGSLDQAQQESVVLDDKEAVGERRPKGGAARSPITRLPDLMMTCAGDYHNSGSSLTS